MLIFTLFMQTSQATEYCTEGGAIEREACLRSTIADLERSCNTTKSTAIVQNKESFIDYRRCSFKVSLPQSYLFKIDEEDNNLDMCTATVSTSDGLQIIDIRSMNNARFETRNIKDSPKPKIPTLEVTHNTQKNNWFVISGYNNEGMIVYWKRVSGDNFISDLYMEYPQHRSSEINSKIGKIAGSFTSD